jgi:hypothetical protein
MALDLTYDPNQGADTGGELDFTYDAGAAKPKKQNKGILGDIGTGLKRGVEQMPGMVTGIADIAAAPVSAITGINRPFSRAADYVGEKTGFQPSKWAEQAAQEYSPEMQQSLKAVEQADGFTGTLKAIGENPRSAVNLIAESLPSTLAGGILARGAMGAVVGAEKLAAMKAAGDTAGLMKAGAIAGGIGEGAVTAGQQMSQTDYNVDPLRAAGAATAAGIGTGIIGGVSGRIANKIGLADIEGSIAAGTLGAGKKAGAGAYAGRIAGGALQEGALEELPQSAQEQVWQNLANGKPWNEGVGKAAAQGLVAGMAMGAGVNALPGSSGKQEEAAPPIVPPARDSINLITDPGPLQGRIDSLLGIGDRPMSDAQRAQYAKDLEASFGEVVGYAAGANGLEVPVTMEDYLRSTLSAADITRDKPLAAGANDQSANRLNQLADEEATQQLDIAPGYVPPVIPVVGPLSAIANAAVQSGAHQTAVMQQAAAQAAKNTPPEGKAGTPAGAQNVATAPAQGPLTEVAGQAPNVATSAPNVATPASAFDVSGKNILQLKHLAAKGQPGWKEAATAELARRNGSISESVPALNAGNSVNLPATSISSLQDQLDKTEPFSEQSQLLTERLQLAVTDDAKSAIGAGEMPVYKVTDHVSVAIHPSAQKEGMIQVTRYTKDGVIGDSQYNSIDEAVRFEGLAHKPRIPSNEAIAHIENSIAAEAEYQKRKNEQQAGAGLPASTAGGSRPAPVANQEPVKNASPTAATVSAETVTPNQEPVKNQSEQPLDMVPAADAQSQPKTDAAPEARKGIRTIDKWTAEELQARLTRGDERGDLSLESRQKIEAQLDSVNRINAEKNAKEIAKAERVAKMRAANEANKGTFLVGVDKDSAERVSVRNGTVYLGDYPAMDYETEDDIAVPEGATQQQVFDALINGKAVTGNSKIFGKNGPEKSVAERMAELDAERAAMSPAERNAAVEIESAMDAVVAASEQHGIEQSEESALSYIGASNEEIEQSRPVADEYAGTARQDQEGARGVVDGSEGEAGSSDQERDGNAQGQAGAVVTETSGQVDRSQWSITPYRYAKDSVVLKITEPDGFKGRLGRIAGSIGGRYTNRAGGYVMSETKARKIVQMAKGGWDANSFTNELTAPKAAEQAPAVNAKGNDSDSLSREMAGFTGVSDAEYALRQLSHKEKQEGDIELGNGKFVTLEQAVEAAKKSMDPADWSKPFQFNRVLDIAPIDWNTMVGAMKNATVDAKKQEEAKPSANEPWQMTRKEWYDAKNNDRAETFGSSGKRNGAAETAARIERKARLNYGVAENGEPVDHRQVIEKAIADGKQIPDEVLADYPDLKESGIALLSPSLGRVDANKVDIAVASKVVADLLSGWRNAPDSRVVATFDDLPAAVRKEIEDQGEKTARGVFHGDTFYLIADEHASANEIEETIFHEVWAHYGLRSMLGANTTRELAGVFDQISASGIMGVNGKDAFRAFARRNGFNTAQTESMLRKAEAFDPRFTEAMKKRILVEELIAKVQEKGDNPSLKRKAQEIIGAIREWLRKVGFSGLMKYSDADLMRLVQKARDTVKYGKRGSSGKGDVPSVLMTAWHGSPHNHDKFDSSKIGTGEGAQAYGHGLYFAGARSVAEWYRNALSKRNSGNSLNDRMAAITIDGKPVMDFGIDMDSELADMAAEGDLFGAYFHANKRADRWDEFASDESYQFKDYAKEKSGAWRNLESALETAKEFRSSEKGRLYQVELAPSEDEYLDWDKPLSEQSDTVKAALDKVGLPKKYHSENKTGSEIYRLLSQDSASHITGKLMDGRGDKAASEYLHSLGIRGIRYLDGSSRSKGEGNSNYVIFSDDDVTITAKYNKAGNDKLIPSRQSHLWHGRRRQECRRDPEVHRFRFP